MTATQKFIPISEIRDDLVFLKDGAVSLVITTSAVNFGLLFETEQMSIIESFAGLLNSLSFPIQVVIHSRRLDVSSYLQVLDSAKEQQTNPGLLAITASYRQFIESIIKEKNVLDKKFYICIKVSSLELGILPKNLPEKGKKALIILTPRRDHLLKQLFRLGLKARQLTTAELIKVFYDIYNPLENNQINDAVRITQNEGQLENPDSQKLRKIPPEARLAKSGNLEKSAALIYRSSGVPSPSGTPILSSPPGPPSLSDSFQSLPPSSPLSVTNLTPPFVVEELPDDES